jgi:hypothetical protein
VGEIKAKMGEGFKNGEWMNVFFCFFVSGSERDFLSLNFAYASVKLLLLPQQFDQCPVRVRHFLVN